jgi:hypothetical protein
MIAEDVRYRYRQLLAEKRPIPIAAMKDMKDTLTAI